MSCPRSYVILARSSRQEAPPGGAAAYVVDLAADARQPFGHVMKLPRHLRYWRCVIWNHKPERRPGGSYRCVRCKQTRRLFG